MSRGKRKHRPVDIIAEPTPEQMARGRYDVTDVVDKLKSGRSIVIGKAYRKRRMLETLALEGLFSDAERKALTNYRHYADMTERSLVSDSLARQEVASGKLDASPSMLHITAELITSRIEAVVGSLAPILRAIIVGDLSPSEWAMQQSGTVERYRRDRQAAIIEPKRHALNQARLDIQMAAKRVEAESEAGA